MVFYPSFIACYNAPHKQIPVQLHGLQIFAWFLALRSLHFPVKNLGDPSCTDNCHQQMFTQDRLNSTTWAISSTLTRRFCNTVLSIYNSMTVFFAESFAWASRPGLILKASSASTKLGSPTAHGSPWDIIKGKGLGPD